VRECTAVLRSLLTHATSSTMVAKLVGLADRVSTSSKTSDRNVAEIDQLHAGIIDHQAVEAARIAANKVIINGGEIAKVEAGQIHLG
jgi:ribosomal protein L16/L10AE